MGNCSKPLRLVLILWSAHIYRAFSIPTSIGPTRKTPTQLSVIPPSVGVFFKSHPLAAAAVVCAVKASLADVVAQARDQESSYVQRRTVSFAVYGSLYQGCVQELIYNNFYTWLFGSSTALSVAIKKVLFDAVFHNALVCIPMSYVVKSLIFRYSVRLALKQYVNDVLHHGLLLKYYVLWMPVNAMIFTIVPTHWRITVMACVSFFWMIILSTISSRPRGEEAKVK